jgi:hypothetical protein
MAPLRGEGPNYGRVRGGRDCFKMHRGKNLISPGSVEHISEQV